MPKAEPSFYSLRLEGLMLAVQLGCSAQERSERQEVRVSVEVRFSEKPKATTTDDLRDTVCYADLSEAIRSHCESREFKLIERMSYDIYIIAHRLAGSGAAIGVTVHKVRPPVENLIGGSYFRCGDFVL